MLYQIRKLLSLRKKLLIDEFFCHFSVPSRLHLDQKKQLQSKVISAIPARYYRLLTSPGLPHTTHSLMGLLNSSIHADRYAGDHL